MARANCLDHVDFTDISIPPTAGELRCLKQPYMPANLPGARHHLDPDSIEKK